jgi:hypothetical protein
LPTIVASLLHCILSDWGIGSWLLLSCFLWAMIRPMALFPIVETCTTSYLRWLVARAGRRAAWLLFTLVLISALLVVVTVLLLLLRKLPLELLLLVLTLLLVLVTLLEWLRWVA